MPDNKMKLWMWQSCPLCGGDGVANMVPEPESPVEEGECPKCEGLGWIKSGRYTELNVSQLKAMLGL